MKFWLIRIVLGFMLGMGAATVVVVLDILLVILIFGSLDAYLNRRHPREEAWLHILGVTSMSAGATAAMVASFLGVMLAPTQLADRGVIRSWLMSATLGAFAGCAVGGMLSLLFPDFLSFGWMIVAVYIGGVLAGSAAAIVLRFRPF